MKQRYSVFEANKTGVYLSQTPQASITLCDFDIKKMNYNLFQNERYCGIYINEGCSGFQVEENYLHNSDVDPLSGNDSTVGIIVFNSGSSNNELYNNHLSFLDYGISAEGTNKGTSSGLRIKCNDFDSCGYDIIVVPDDCIGIYDYQGSDSALATTSANNLFSYMGTIEYVDLNDINNRGEFITYFYPRNYGIYNVEPKYIDTLKVGKEESDYIELWTFNVGCPSRINNDTSIQEIRSLNSLYKNNTDSINNLIQNLEDGGNTEELNYEIQTSWPEDAYIIYSELINNSPYLSDSVMVSAVKKENVLSGTMVTDVLSINPQAAKKDTIMDAIYKRSNPLNNAQLDQINQGLSTIGLKEKLEVELSFFKTKKSYYDNALLRIFRKDTSTISVRDSIINIYKSINSLNASYQLAIEYLWLRDTSNAMNTLDSIPFMFALDDKQAAQHTDYEDYFNWIIEIIADGRTTYSAVSDEIQGLYEIYNNASGKPKCLIRNLLIQIDAFSYSEPFYFPTLYKTSKIELPENIQKRTNKYFFIYPNPSKNHYYVECVLEKYYQNALVTIYNPDGKIIDEISIDSQPFRKIINARNYKPGIYIGRLCSNGKIIESIKFIIIQ